MSGYGKLPSVDLINGKASDDNRKCRERGNSRRSRSQEMGNGNRLHQANVPSRDQPIDVYRYNPLARITAVRVQRVNTAGVRLDLQCTPQMSGAARGGGRCARQQPQAVRRACSGCSAKPPAIAKCEAAALRDLQPPVPDRSDPRSSRTSATHRPSSPRLTSPRLKSNVPTRKTV
jgi:hypothetical protein